MISSVKVRLRCCQKDDSEVESAVLEAEHAKSRVEPVPFEPAALWKPGSCWECADTVALFGVLGCTFALNVIGISQLEFFRHTEADRTLIAWEMLEQREFVLPHLLHSLILTKPPLFYWMLAAVISLFGSAAEAVVRFPSVLCSVAWAGSHFAALRCVGATRRGALLGVAMLVTGMSFFVQASLAEIDMLFGFLCSLALSMLYLGLLRESGAAVLLSSLALGLATLAKGPPAVAFYGVAIIGGWTLVSRRRPGGTRFFVRWSLAGAGLASAVVLPWLALVGSRVGYDALAAEFHREVLDRVVRETHHVRGLSFYLGTLFVGHLPWSLLLIPAMVRVVRRRPLFETLPADLRGFLVYHGAIVAAVFVMLTIAQGKSNRYIFPVVGSGSLLFFGLLLALLQTSELRTFCRSLSYLLWGLAVALPAAAAAVHLPGVSLLQAGAVAVAACLSLAWLGYALRQERDGARTMAALVAVVFALRLGFAEVYAPARNAERSVRAMAAEIHELMPAGAVLYNIEIYDRWVNYYLKRLGRESYRLTPQEVEQPRPATDGRVYLFIDLDEEAWRLEQLRQLDPSLVELKRYAEPLPASAIVAVNPAVLGELRVHRHFPTVPSAPYYFDPVRAAAWSGAKER